jgi:acetyltransferase
MLAYLADDPETGVIGGYLESIADGPRFLNELKATCLKKPVILWKVGLNPEGGKAAGSHTGALSTKKTIWQAVVRQTGAVSVKGFDVLTDALMSFSLLPPRLGDRIAILSGPGGMAVGAAEACGEEGLQLAELSRQTKSELSAFVPRTGTSLANPVDVGLGASLEIDIYIKAARALARDPGVDAVAVIGAGLDRERNETYTRSIIDIHRETGCPFLMISIPGFEEEFARAFCDAGIPFYETGERAFGAYARVLGYQRWRAWREALAS